MHAAAGDDHRAAQQSGHRRCRMIDRSLGRYGVRLDPLRRIEGRVTSNRRSRHGVGAVLHRVADSELSSARGFTHAGRRGRFGG